MFRRILIVLFFSLFLAPPVLGSGPEKEKSPGLSMPEFGGGQQALLERLNEAREDERLQSQAPAQPGFLELVGQLGGSPTAVAVCKGKLLVAIGPRVVQLDFTNPANPTVVAQSEVFPGLVNDLTCGPVGHVLVAGSGSKEPHTPWDHLFVLETNTLGVVGEVVPEGSEAVAYQDEMAYVATRGGTGLQIFDLSDPTQPQLLSSYGQQEMFGVAVASQHAYLATADGLMIVDVSNPVHPKWVGQVDLPGLSRSVAVEGNLALVAAEQAGLQVVEISDPATPQVVGSYSPSDLALRVVAQGKLAYLAASQAGLLIFDVSDPSTPRLLNQEYARFWQGQAHDVALVGDEHIVVTDIFGATRLVDVSNPENPHNEGAYLGLGYVTAAEAAGENLFTTGYNAVVYSLDLSNPAQPRQIGWLDMGARGFSLVVQQERAYVAAGPDGLQIINVSDLTAPREVGRLAGIDVNLVAVEGNWAYLASSTSPELHVVNVSEPELLGVTGVYTSPQRISHVFAAGSHAYVAAGDWGLRIVNVEIPNAPTEVGSYPAPVGFTATGQVFVDPVSQLAYVNQRWAGGLDIFDVFDPTSPQQVGWFPIIWDPTSLLVKGEHAFVGDGASGSLVINVEDPTTPFLVDQVYLPGYTRDVEAQGGYLYVANGAGGLFVYQQISKEVSPIYLPLMGRN